jgi:hypothetical protein
LLPVVDVDVVDSAGKDAVDAFGSIARAAMSESASTTSPHCMPVTSRLAVPPDS